MNTGGQPRTDAAPGACVFLQPAWTRLPKQTRLPAAAAAAGTHKCCLSDLAGISPEVQLQQETEQMSPKMVSVRAVQWATTSHQTVWVYLSWYLCHLKKSFAQHFQRLWSEVRLVVKCQLPASSVWKSQCLHLDCNDVCYVQKPKKSLLLLMHFERGFWSPLLCYWIIINKE